MRGQSRISRSGGRDRWLISYADLMTLLFAFFAVLFASSMHQIRMQPGHGTEANLSAAALAPDRNSSIPGRMTESRESEEGFKPKSHSIFEKLQVRTELKTELEAALSMEIAHKHVVIREEADGVAVSLPELGFFGSGQASLLPGTSATLNQIARVVVARNLHVRVEGHSDDILIHNAKYRSNWELSTDRAQSVLRLLLEQPDIDPSSLSVAGYGPYRPVAANDSPAGRSRNRRVDLVLIDKI